MSRLERFLCEERKTLHPWPRSSPTESAPDVAVLSSYGGSTLATEEESFNLTLL
jgi:hypothetical protein